MAYSLMQRRGAVYYFRKLVPPDLQPLIGKTAIVVSLRTSDLATAKARYAAELQKATRLLAAARITMTKPGAAVERIARRIVQESPLSDNEDQRDVEHLALTDLLERLADKVSLTLEERGQKRAAEVLLADEPGATADNPALSTMFDLWRAEQRPTVKSWREFERAREAFIEVCGDLPVRSIRKDEVRHVKSVLLSSVSKKDGVTPIRPATVRKLLNTLGAVLSWAERNGYIESNPARGVSRIAETKAMLEDDRRMPFTPEQARDIMARLPERGYIRWCWLLGFWTGARLAELVGLRQEDVVEVEGIQCIQIVPHGGRGLKNRSSKRIIPLHPKVLEAGFHAGVLPLGSSAAYVSRRLTPWMRKVCGISDPRLSFHSTRHAFKDACRRARIPEEVHDALTGHRGTSVSRGYGLGVPVSVMAEELAKVRY